MSFFLQLNIKEDILKNVGNQTVECRSDFHSMEEKKILQKSMASVNCLGTDILQNIFFYVQQKKETFFF